jgi:alkanesulfonate monooxygenase SsuD/methylene tetrahydromethanopterin reductase-like flavin-dependent oxidoreductase (luciferase family)
VWPDGFGRGIMTRAPAAPPNAWRPALVDPELRQQIHFCATPAGVRVAYATAGRGPALLVPAAWIGHLELAWQDPAVRAFDAPLAAHRTVVRYDKPDCGRPLRLGLLPVPELPIWLAALGERTSRVAAELGDGWIPMFVSPDRLAGRAADLGRARRAAGLRPGPLTVAAGPWTVADADAGAARDVVASCVAWYLSAMGDVYGRTVADHGYGAAVEAVKAANPRPRPQEGTVPAEARVVLDEFTAHGTPGQVREQLERWDSVADVTLVALPPGMAWDAVEATLRAAAP